MDIKEYINNQDTDGIIHPWEKARHLIVNKIIQRITKDSEKNNIVDIGCGDAKLLNAITNHETSRFIGIDTAFDKQLIDSITNKYNRKNLELYKSINDISPKNFKADIILLLDVLEHVENDAEFFKSITDADYIKKDTYFIITVPAFQFLYIQRDKWLGHYRRYNTQMVKKYASDNNLEIEQKGYFFFSLFCARFLQKIFTKPKEQKEYLGINNWNGSKTLAVLIEKILFIDFKINYFISKTGINIPGLTCYLICKKR